MKLSLCMIVKDEEDSLVPCLTSVQCIVNEIIIVDTGSTDHTIDIAKNFTDKVYSYPWQNDFSLARNLALDKANGEWILILDADEQLVPNQEDLIDAALKKDVEGYQLQIINFLSSKPHDYTLDLACRLFRNKPNYRYTGSLHENINDAILISNPKAKIIDCPEIKIFHYGYLPSVIKAKNKSSRNMTLLKEEYQRAKDPFFLYAIGCEYYQKGDYAKALPYFIEHLQTFHQDDGYRSDLINKTIWCYKELKEYNQALAILEESKRFYPKFTDLYFVESLIYWGLKDYRQALIYLEECLQLGEPPPEYSSWHGVGSFRAFFTKGLVYEEQLCLNLALDNYLLALQNNSEFLEPLKQIINLFREWSSITEGLTFLKKFIDFGSANFLLFLIKILIDLREHVLAAKYCLILKNNKANLPKSVLEEGYLDFYRGVIAFYLQDFSTSENYFTRVPDGSPLNSLTLTYKFLLNLFFAKPNDNKILIQKLSDKNHKLSIAFNFITNILSGHSLNEANIIINNNIFDTLLKFITTLIKAKRLDLALPLIRITYILPESLIAKEITFTKTDLQLLIGNLLFTEGFIKEGFITLKRTYLKQAYNLDSLLNLHRYYLNQKQFLKANVIQRTILKAFNIPKTYVLLVKNYQEVVPCLK